ncbi:MAG: hypothetical protein KZQ99_11790 [Candidatus Thiodiazotropha sp. (ex Dulcina madagascariensis)]|nr:hypothetical protein [Candidatus Thiodiazotropha sp. (ex Dulcina madagascariensis)]
MEYLGLRFDEGFLADLVVEKKVVVELKCVEKLDNAHNDSLRAWRLCERQL